MGCHYLKDSDGTVCGIVTLKNIYRYKGFTFEYHSYLGPVKLKANFDPAAREGMRFYRVIREWEKLTKKQQEKTRISG